MPEQCVVYCLGLVPYEQAWKLQSLLASRIAAGDHPPALLLQEHPHTYTFGRRGQAENLLWDQDELERRGIAVLWVDRGGDVTYHGPGQLVGYPLLPLAPGGLKVKLISNGSTLFRLPQADYVGYVRRLEEALVLSLMRLGVASGQLEGLTGVWVQPHALSSYPGCDSEMQGSPAKIAAIGVKVDVRGVTRHGFALNVDPDMSYWEGIVGCGLREYPVISLADLLYPTPPMQEVEHTVMAAFGELFAYQMVVADPDQVRSLLEKGR